MSESEPLREWLRDPPTVGAVLVSHNSAAWLPKVLASFASMEHAPDVWRAVDVDSTDGSAELVRDSFGPERVVRVSRGTGFGDAVKAAVAKMPRTEWLWLLHDDAAVEPGTLAGLLDEATGADDIAVVGPKVREWPSLQRILEVGVTVTASGARETGLEAGEPDAGQHDRPRDVLAVGTVGMLVRRDVWDELDGLAPDLPLYFDDIDFGWRVARAGYRVRTAPGGVVFHAEGSRRGTRRAVRGDLPRWDERRAAIWTQLAHAGPLEFWWKYVRLLLGGFFRVLGLLIAKAPEQAGDELSALRAVYTRPLALRRARRLRNRSARVSRAAVKPLLAPRWLGLQNTSDTVKDVTTALVRPEAVQSAGRRSTVLDQVPDETVDLDDTPWWRERPWLAAVAGLTVLALVAGRNVLGGFADGVEGGALPRSPETAGGWWELFVGGERAVGLSDGVPPAFTLPLAVVSTPVWTRPDLIVFLLLLLAVPLSAVAAHRFARHLPVRRLPRTIWAISYAVIVAAVGAIPQGRLGTVVALVLAPVAANLAWQLAQQPSWRAAVRLGMIVALAAAFAPVALLLALGGVALVWYSEGAWVSRHLLVSLATAVVLLGPWLWVRGWPSRWWWEAGDPVPASETVLDIVAGRGGGVAAPVWLSIPIVLLGVVALVPERTRLAVRMCWMFGVFCLAVAVLGHVMNFAGPSDQADLSPWVGLPATLWLASLATAALLATPALRDYSTAVGRVALIAALVGPVAMAGWWVVRGAGDPLTDAAVSEVPAFLVDLPGRTLVIEPVDDQVEYRIVSGRGGYLGQEVFTTSDSGTDDLTDAVQRLLGRAGDDDIETLRDNAVSAIYLTDAETDPVLAQRIDAAPSLEQTGSDSPTARAWTLVNPPQADRVDVPWWRQLTSWLQIAAWVAALLAIAPVRRRAEPRATPEELAEDRTQLTAVQLPQDSSEVRS